ncbi:MAG: PHP domain-containing protein [bacterium]|nr:PHP domain-containing protein [bacterium]
MRCDFHTHSDASDGDLTPEALIEQAQREGIDVLALTDHDDVSGVSDAARHCAELGLVFVPGVEISVTDDDGERRLHILGLGIDADCEFLVERLQQTQEMRSKRAARIVGRLNELGVPLELERVQEIAGRGSIGRPHVARALVECGAVEDEDQAFGKYLRRGRPAFIDHPGMSSAEAIDSIHAAGGIACLAHPPLSTGVSGPGGLEIFIERLVRLGLDGVEVQHPGHRSNHVKRLRRFARQFGLVETGGSDFHGNSRPDVRLGCGRGNLKIGSKVYEGIRTRIAQRRDNAEMLTPASTASTLGRPS